MFGSQKGILGNLKGALTKVDLEKAIRGGTFVL